MVHKRASNELPEHSKSSPSSIRPETIFPPSSHNSDSSTNQTSNYNEPNSIQSSLPLQPLRIGSESDILKPLTYNQPNLAFNQSQVVNNMPQTHFATNPSMNPALQRTGWPAHVNRYENAPRLLPSQRAGIQLGNNTMPVTNNVRTFNSPPIHYMQPIQSVQSNMMFCSSNQGFLFDRNQRMGGGCQCHQNTICNTTSNQTMRPVSDHQQSEVNKCTQDNSADKIDEVEDNQELNEADKSVSNKEGVKEEECSVVREPCVAITGVTDNKTNDDLLNNLLTPTVGNADQMFGRVSSEAIESFLSDCRFLFKQANNRKGSYTHTIVLACKTTLCPKKVQLRSTKYSPYWSVNPSQSHLPECSLALTKNHFLIYQSVKDQYQLGVILPRKINQVLRRLPETKDLEFTLQNIYYCVRKFKSKIYNANHLSTETLKNYNQSLAYGDDHQLVCIGQHEGPDELVSLYSTPHLMKGLANSQTICIDTTYKLLVSNYPVVVVRSFGRDNKFYLHVIGFTRRETKSSFISCWQIILMYLRSLTINWYPRAVMSDCAEAIHGSIVDVFPAATRLVCWAHVSRNVLKKIPKEDKNLRERIYQDICKLQLASDCNMFNKAVQVFFQYWHKHAEMSLFLNYFKKEYIQRNYSWYEGASILSPSSNNGLEAFNGIIKKYILEYRKNFIIEFVDRMSSIIESKSEEMNVDGNCERCKIHYPEKEINNEYSFIEIGEYNGELLFMKSTNDNMNNQNLYLDIVYGAILLCDIEEYKKLIMIVVVSVRKKQHGIEWEDFRCTCYQFLKKKRCDHVFAVAKNVLGLINLKMFIGKKCKKGRPKYIRANSALKKD